MTSGILPVMSASAASSSWTRSPRSTSGKILRRVLREREKASTTSPLPG